MFTSNRTGDSATLTIPGFSKCMDNMVSKNAFCIQIPPTNNIKIIIKMHKYLVTQIIVKHYTGYIFYSVALSMYHIGSAYKSKTKMTEFQRRSLLSELSPSNLYSNDPAVGIVN